MNPVRDFVIGSSLPVAINLFYRVFYKIPLSSRNYQDREYAIIAPLYLGIMNLLGHFISKQFGLTGISKIALTTLISVLVVYLFVYHQKSYPDLDWRQYIPRLFVRHFISYLTAYQIDLIL